MSLDSYFKRSTKVIDDEPTSECSPLPLASSESTTVIPATQVTPLQRQQMQEDSKDNSLLSRSQTLPLGLADTEEEEEKESSTAKALGAPKKEHLHRRQSSCCSWSQQHSSSTPHSRTCWWWCFCRHFANSERRSRKRWQGRGCCGSSCYKETASEQPLSPWLLWDPPVLITLPSVPKGYIWITGAFCDDLLTTANH